jgi:hypothetical protein
MRRSKKVITMAKQVSMIVIARAHDALKKRATATTDKNAPTGMLPQSHPVIWRV